MCNMTQTSGHCSAPRTFLLAFHRWRSSSAQLPRARAANSPWDHTPLIPPLQPYQLAASPGIQLDELSCGTRPWKAASPTRWPRVQRGEQRPLLCPAKQGSIAVLCLPCTLRAFSSLNGRERGSLAEQAATHTVCHAVHQQKQPRSGNQMGIQQERSASCSAVCAHQSSRSLQRFPLSAFFFFFFPVFFNSPVFAAGVSQKGCLETIARRCYTAESHGENPSARPFSRCLASRLAPEQLGTEMLAVLQASEDHS